MTRLDAWQQRTLACAVLIALLALIVFAPSPGHTALMSRVHDYGHVIIFTVITLAIVMLGRRNARFRGWSATAQYGCAFAIAVSFGFITELLQTFTGRDASWSDLRNDVCGAAGALLLLAMFEQRLRGASLRCFSVGAAASLLFLPLLPVLQTFADTVERARQMPVLLQPDGAYFLAPMRSQLRVVELPAAWQRTAGERAIEVHFDAGPWPGFDLYEPEPDWRRYRQLHVDVTNPADVAVPLSLIVQDRQHKRVYEDRSNTEVQVPAATRMTLRIPLAHIESGPRQRRLSMDQIDAVLMIRTDDTPVTHIYVSKIWLD